MAYNLVLSNGNSLVTVADGTTDTSATSLTLIGKNFAGYGQFLNENFVALLENFSNNSSPPHPLQGQIWWDSTNKILKVYSGSAWKTVSSSTSQSSAPIGPNIGDLWWDTNNGQLKVWSGSSFITVGPAVTLALGQTGAVAASIVALDSSVHTILKFFIGDNVLGVLSSETFHIGPLTGFSTAADTLINPGFNLSSVTANTNYNGNATNALLLGGVAATSFLRSDQASTSNFPITIANNSGLLVGATPTTGDITLTAAASEVKVSSVVVTKDMNLYVNVGGSPTKGISISGTTGLATVIGNPTAALGIATKQYVDAHGGGGGGDLTAVTTNILPSVTGTYHIGDSSHQWTDVWATTFHGTSTQADYADLAEKFSSDRSYSPGTVVELGGMYEITAVSSDLSEDVFGVISSNAAYLMNARAGNDDTHPPVALQGRVPVRVIGAVKKGDRLVSAGNGMARAANRNEVTSFNVIGRSLEDKVSLDEGMIEAIVKLNS